jgi:hypothetical protein
VRPEKLSGHSLRAGYATAAAAAGVEERKIANVTRHKNLPVLRRYIRSATAFDDVGEVPLAPPRLPAQPAGSPQAGPPRPRRGAFRNARAFRAVLGRGAVIGQRHGFSFEMKM